MLETVLDEVPQHDREGVGIDSGHYRCLGSVERDPPGHARLPRHLVDDHLRDACDVGRLPALEAAALCSRQLHQLLRQPRKALQRPLDLLRPLPGNGVLRFGNESLCLCQSGGNGRAQFVRRIGGETSFGIQGAAQSEEEMVHGVRDRPDLGRQAGGWNGREVALPRASIPICRFRMGAIET